MGILESLGRHGHKRLHYLEDDGRRPREAILGYPQIAMIPQRKHNPKRRIVDVAPYSEELVSLAARVRYIGSGHHKRFPGDYQLVPPLQPRRDADLCDLTEEFRAINKRGAETLLKAGVSLGIVSGQIRGRFPQNVWALTETGGAFEAELDNQELGTYHGYPMGANDPFAQTVIQKWHDRKKRVLTN